MHLPLVGLKPTSLSHYGITILPIESKGTYKTVSVYCLDLKSVTCNRETAKLTLDALMAVYMGVEPISPDRQSGIIADIPIDQKGTVSSCIYIPQVRALYEGYAVVSIAISECSIESKSTFATKK